MKQNRSITCTLHNFFSEQIKLNTRKYLSKYKVNYALPHNNFLSKIQNFERQEKMILYLAYQRLRMNWFLQGYEEALNIYSTTDINQKKDQCSSYNNNKITTKLFRKKSSFKDYFPSLLHVVRRTSF